MPMAELQSRLRSSRYVLLASLWLTVLVLAVKIWVGWATQSLSLIAQAMHTLIDSFSILLSIIALSSPYASGREVWGGGKLEGLMALFLIAFMGFACCSLLVMAIAQLWDSWQGIEGMPIVRMTGSLFQLLAIMTAVSFCLACFERYEARLLDITALKVSANRLFLDVWLMALLLISFIGIKRGFLWLDPVLAIVMIPLSVISCWQVFRRQLPSLVRQTAIAPEAVAEVVHQVEGITQCYDIRSHGVLGRQLFVEMHLVLHPECVSIAQNIATRVERHIQQQFGPAQVTIHIDGLN